MRIWQIPVEKRYFYLIFLTTLKTWWLNKYKDSLRFAAKILSNFARRAVQPYEQKTGGVRALTPSRFVQYVKRCNRWRLSIKITAIIQLIF